MFDSRLLRLVCVGLLAVQSFGLPSFDINLDDAPEKRWVEVTKHYRQELASMMEAFMPGVDKQIPKADQQAWLDAVDFGQEIESELQSIVTVANDSRVTLPVLKLFNMIYELQSPTACSGVLWATANGTVIHGRNMDYALTFSGPDGKKMNWPDVTFEATFKKGGVPLMKSSQWPGSVGFHTAMRPNGWSFEQNSRLTENDWHKNLEAAKKGGQPFMIVARRLMEATADFNEAVDKLYSEKFIAPQYFVVSGAGAFQGTVMTIDRLGQHLSETPPKQSLQKSKDVWHLVQTNDDLLHEALDWRRPLAEMRLSGAKQDTGSAQYMMQFMHTPYLFNNFTVFSTVMIPATGYFKTVLPDEPPGPLPSLAMTGMAASDTDDGGKSSSKPAGFLQNLLSKIRTTSSRVTLSLRGKKKQRQQAVLTASADYYSEDAK